MNILEILSKIKNKIFYGAGTLYEYIELCQKDGAPFINMQIRYYGFRDFYRIEYQSPIRGFSEKIGGIPSYKSIPIFNLERKKTNIKTLERVVKVAEKIEKTGIKVIFRSNPFKKSGLIREISDEKQGVRKIEYELGLK